jgi:hypothetical protein
MLGLEVKLARRPSKMMQNADPVEASDETLGGASTVVTRDEIERLRTRAHWGYGGFAIGIGLGFACTAAQMATFGYHFLLVLDPVLNLIWAPFLGVVIGRALSRTRPEKPRKWTPPQLRVLTLMVIVTYVALLFGVGVSTIRIGIAAQRYLQESVSSAERARIYREQGRKCDSDAKLKRANVADLRAGKVPVGLLPIQREFLQSLEDDPKVTPDYRAYVRGPITEGEEAHRIRQEHNVVVMGRIAEHFEKLAAKYEWYRWHPWLPIEPDPPVPE